MRNTGRGGNDRGGREERAPGIVIHSVRGEGADSRRPRIAAFIWGGKVRPSPTLPFGRWKPAA